MRLAADANVLLSAVIGGRARLVLGHGKVTELLTTQKTFAEVEKYAVVLGKKKRLSLDLLLLAVATLPVTVVERTAYSTSLPAASKRIGRRDPDDVDLLALALHLKIPVWSNDKDFEGTGVDWFTTESLLRHLGLI